MGTFKLGHQSTSARHLHPPAITVDCLQVWALRSLSHGLYHSERWTVSSLTSVQAPLAGLAAWTQAEVLEMSQGKIREGR